MNITYEDLRSAVQRTVQKHPDSVNPRVGSRCRYQWQGERCLIGEALINELGVPYNPFWEHRTAEDILDSMGATRQATLFAYRVQRYADQLDPSADGPAPRKWRHAWDLFKQAEEERRGMVHLDG